MAAKMANLAASPLVNAKLFRHFAAVTFAITLCVAMFANGEARQVVTDGINNERQAAHLREADAKKFGPRQIGRATAETVGGFGDEYDPDYGMGLAESGSQPEIRSAGSFSQRGFEGGDQTAAQALKALSPEELARLNPEQQGAYLKGIRTQGAPKREQEVHDFASIEAGSRARSGSRTSD